MKSLCLPIFLLLMLIALPAQAAPDDIHPALEGIESQADLDARAAFSFAIMSDNKGDSPLSSPEFASMLRWIYQSGDQFVVGLGDHLKVGWENSFIPFVENERWWLENFYPNIADGENEYYGEGQGDWGAGSPTLELCGVTGRGNTTIRDNGAEYYSRIEVGEWTVHLIQLHYSDSPPEEAIAFNTDTRQYLIDTLNSIDKKDKDIVIAAAHSMNGFWADRLSEEHQAVLIDKADLVLSATTHVFEVIDGPGGDEGPLYINTGSITWPNRGSAPGYVQVHVLEDPPAMLVQYVDASLGARELTYRDHSALKPLGGKIVRPEFRPMRPDEDFERIVAHLDQEITEEKMAEIARELYLKATGADEAYLPETPALPAGDVSCKDLLKVFPYNDQLYAVTLTAEQLEKAFEGAVDPGEKDQLTLAVQNYLGEVLIGHFHLTRDKYHRTGLKEIPLLEEYLRSGAQQ